jgi:hypothetical protein
MVVTTKMAAKHEFSIAPSIFMQINETWDLERKSSKNSVEEFFSKLQNIGLNQDGVIGAIVLADATLI